MAMDNYVAIVLDSELKAFDVLHELWRMNDRGKVVVNSAAVVRRDVRGRIEVVANENDAGDRTLVATAAGFLIGAIAAAAAVTALPLAVGTAVGAAAGLTGDAAKSRERQQATSETQYILPIGKAAVVAEVNEESTTAVDTLASEAGGKLYRRTRSTVLSDQWFGDDFNLNLYPYDYDPGVPPPK
jgi:hypothetical protein